MTDVCKFYKPSACRGDKTCTNSSLCNTKYCPYVKDGNFKNNKATEACKGYAVNVPAPCGISGIYMEGFTSRGKVYIKFHEESDHIVADLVDSNGCHISSGYLFNVYKRTGKIEMMASINSSFGLDLDDRKSLKII
jgi:hypothetical protein